MECMRETQKDHCNCTSEPCVRTHKCGDCVQHHRQSDELPACYFNKEFERTYDRSISNFLRMRGKA